MYRAAPGPFPVGEPRGSPTIDAHGGPRAKSPDSGRDAKALGVAYLEGPFCESACWHIASRSSGAMRQLKDAFHPLARWPGFLHRAPHLGLRLARLLGLVSNLMILSSCTRARLRLLPREVFLAMSSSRIVAVPRDRRPKKPRRRGQAGFWARRLGGFGTWPPSSLNK